MSRFRGLVLALLIAILTANAGCGTAQKWEVIVENESEVPCSVFVTLEVDGSTKAEVENVQKGEKFTLIAGDGKTVVQTVKVVCGRDEDNLTPNTELLAGNRYSITVDADGKVNTAVSVR